jgi:hypothetical protein
MANRARRRGGLPGAPRSRIQKPQVPRFQSYQGGPRPVGLLRPGGEVDRACEGPLDHFAARHHSLTVLDEDLRLVFSPRNWSIVGTVCTFVHVQSPPGPRRLLSGLTAPSLLLGISAAISGIVMFIYSVLLIILNRRALPEATKICGVRPVAMAWAVPFFGGFSVVLVIDRARTLLSGGG